MQKPSLGRIVLVTVDPHSNNGSDVAPAVITRVWSDTMLNVRVLRDGTDVAWMTSITLHETRDELDAAAARREATAPHLAGTIYHAAFWPPRV
jgi:hypothetical protein